MAIDPHSRDSCSIVELTNDESPGKFSPSSSYLAATHHTAAENMRQFSGTVKLRVAVEFALKDHCLINQSMTSSSFSSEGS